VVASVALAAAVSTTLVVSATPAIAAGAALAVAPQPFKGIALFRAQRYQCLAGTERLFFDNWNVARVAGNGSEPAFSTNGRPYCVVQVASYHYNNGLGAKPGTMALFSGGQVLGYWQATGLSGQGGVANAAWIARPARPVVISGFYWCFSSDASTWSQDSGSLGRGFFRIWVERARRI
jgi:hypothetical protein